jgi:hypothetical protein
VLAQGAERLAVVLVQRIEQAPAAGVGQRLEDLAVVVGVQI